MSITGGVGVGVVAELFSVIMFGKFIRLFEGEPLRQELNWETVLETGLC